MMHLLKINRTGSLPKAAPGALVQRDPTGRVIPFRIPHEFYPTPPEAVRALMAVEQFDGSIWEPACGDGGIASVLRGEFGCDVVASDLMDYGFGEAGVDFLEQRQPRARHIVTNPPYGFGLGDAFAVRALWLTAQTGGKVAFLLNITSLVHHKRTAWWRQNPPAGIWAVDNIVCWPDERHGYGPPPRYFAKHRYCWVVWDPSHRGPTQFDWLTGAEFR